MRGQRPSVNLRGRGAAVGRSPLGPRRSRDICVPLAWGGPSRGVGLCVSSPGCAGPLGSLGGAVRQLPGAGRVVGRWRGAVRQLPRGLGLLSLSPRGRPRFLMGVGGPRQG